MNMPRQKRLFEVGTKRSKYRCTKIAGGFVVEASDRPRVMVEQFPTHLLIWNEESAPVRIGLVEYHALLNHIAEGLNRNWVSPKANANKWRGAKSWAIQQTRHAVAPQVYEKWLQITGSSDKLILAVQRNIFSATFKAPPILFKPELYSQHYLIEDSLRFRSACVAITHVLALIRRRTICNQIESPLVRGYTIQQLSNDIELQLESLKRWPDLFSEDTAYTSLRRTLTRLPGGIPSTLFLNLPNIQLRRPIHNRLELAVILLASEHRNRVNEKVFHFTSAKQIKKAMKVVADDRRLTLSSRRITNIDYLVGECTKIRERHKGSIVGLAKKASASRVAEIDRQQKLAVANATDLSPLKMPPIPLPTTKGIHFLKISSDLKKEGQHMKHCVLQYLPVAITGDGYFFHAKHKDEEATIQVDHCGRVVQACGPKNQSNHACVWGGEVLNRWGANLRQSTNALKNPANQSETTYNDDDLPF